LATIGLVGRRLSSEERVKRTGTSSRRGIAAGGGERHRERAGPGPGLGARAEARLLPGLAWPQRAFCLRRSSILAAEGDSVLLVKLGGPFFALAGIRRHAVTQVPESSTTLARAAFSATFALALAGASSLTRYWHAVARTSTRSELCELRASFDP
jgi:hypothetical protein